MTWEQLQNYKSHVLNWKQLFKSNLPKQSFGFNNWYFIMQTFFFPQKENKPLLNIFLLDTFEKFFIYLCPSVLPPFMKMQILLAFAKIMIDIILAILLCIQMVTSYTEISFSLQKIISYKTPPFGDLRPLWTSLWMVQGDNS